MAAPGTPPGVGGGSVDRAEMSAAIELSAKTLLAGMFGKMEELMGGQHQKKIIQDAIHEGLEPVQEDLAALTRRMSRLEEKYARQNAAGDGGEDTWYGWHNYGSSSTPAWHRMDDDDVWPDPTPYEATWAERAGGKAAGSNAKASGKSVAKGGKSAAAKTPPSASAKAYANKIRISTFGGERVKIADLKETVLEYLAEQQPAQTIAINGSIFGNSYTVVFGGSAEQGAACALAALKALKIEGGAYRKVHCRSAIDGRPPVQLYFNPDKNASQQASEFHFRVFKRAVHATHGEESWLVDPRDRMLSLAFRPIVQLLPVRGTAGYKVLFHNPAALELFTPEQQATVAAAYRTAADADTSRG
jgi:hypothetical protein